MSTGLRELPNVLDQLTGQAALLAAYLALTIAALGTMWGVTAKAARWQAALRQALRPPSESREDETVVETAARFIRKSEAAYRKEASEPARMQVSELYQGTDVRRSAAMIVVGAIALLGALTMLWLLPERTSSTASTPAAVPAGQSEGPFDGPPSVVRVMFLGDTPDIASSPEGCTPALIDYALMIGGTLERPVLRFINGDAGPVPPNADTPIPKRSGPCKAPEWQWTVGEPELVRVEKVSQR
ncbi:hypothetical protein [Lentzea cavernae]|uniref:hypothetical protein n=1 Tax=Lentzea cavernae TaxID=2020703 RepID=UPI00174DD45F|nr:hypothetical protein [Lentzea cavernae]